MDYKLNSSDSKNVYYETLNGYKYKYVFYAEIKYFDKAYCQKKVKKKNVQFVLKVFICCLMVKFFCLINY